MKKLLDEAGLVCYTGLSGKGSGSFPSEMTGVTGFITKTKGDKNYEYYFQLLS